MRAAGTRPGRRRAGSTAVGRQASCAGQDQIAEVSLIDGKRAVSLTSVRERCRPGKSRLDVVVTAGGGGKRRQRAGAAAWGQPHWPAAPRPRRAGSGTLDGDLVDSEQVGQGHL